MVIRKAELAELDEIMKIFGIARQYMREKGNMSQWINNREDRQEKLKELIKLYKV